MDINLAAQKICEILRINGAMNLGELGPFIKFSVQAYGASGLKSFLEMFPDKFVLTYVNKSLIYVSLASHSDDDSTSVSEEESLSEPAVELGESAARRLKEVLQEMPGTTWSQLNKKEPRLGKAILYNGHQQAIKGPLEFLRRLPHLVTVVMEDDRKNHLYPANYQHNSTNNSTSTTSITPTHSPPANVNNYLHSSQHDDASEDEADGVIITNPFRKLSITETVVPAQTKVKKLPVMIVDSLASNSINLFNRPALTQAVEHLEHQPKIGVDCEGSVNLGRTGQLALVQIASPTRVFLFDVLVSSQTTKQLMLAFLKDIMESNCWKVFHDCRRDSEALFFQHGIELNNVLDTQVMFGVYQRIKGTLNSEDSPTKRIGLNKLLQECNLQMNVHKDDVGKQMDKNPRYWATRPMTTKMIQYASEDVSQLIDLAEAIQNTIHQETTKASMDLSRRHSKIFTTDGNSGYLAVASLPQNVPLALRFENGKQVFFQLLEQLDSQVKATTVVRPQQDTEFLSILKSLPAGIADAIKALQAKSGKYVIELVVDQHRNPIIRYNDDTEEELKLKTTDMSVVVKSLFHFKGASTKDEIFTVDNRTGIPETHHRISAIRNKNREIVGLTYRIGRHVAGVANLIQDIIQTLHAGNKARSLLVLGPPGVGKTTLLRDITKMLADELKKRVIVVDTSNEIGGDSEPPHACIGRARRMQVPHREDQHEILIEAVQNHNPQVIVIDEIGTPKEVEAARTISQRGVTLVGTAHGVSLSTLLKNPQLRALVGGVQPVILSAQEAQRRAINSATSENKKTVLERGGAPTFDILIEVLSHKHWRLYSDVAKTVDEMLAGRNPTLQERWQDEAGNMFACFSKLHSENSSDWLDGLFAMST